MRKFIAPTEDYIKGEKSFVASDVTSGSDVTIELESNNGFSENDYVILGTEGDDQAHIAQINASVSGDTDIQVDDLKYDLKEDTQVRQIEFNKRKFYGADSEDGSYSELTSDGSPKNIEVDNPNGTLFEYTGNNGYTWFKATYYNSTEFEETSLDDANAVKVGDTSNRYCSLHAIREQAGLVNNPYIDSSFLERKREEAESEIKSYISDRYSLPLEEIPDTIRNICVLLAAGYIDYQEFGGDGDGVEWLGEARGMLNKIQRGEMKLTDSSDEELNRKDVGKLKGNPDNSSDDPVFSMDDRY